jgi:transaldolase
MEIWLETSNLGMVQKANQMGVLHGVATNPTIAARSGLALEDLLQKLLTAQSGPVAAQVVSNKAEAMIQQGAAFAVFSDRMVVKIPVTREGLQAIHELSQRKIPVIATAVFDLNQTILAARAGATYISPYFSHICEADQDGIEVLRSMVNLLKQYGYSSQIIATSLKSIQQALDCSALGVHGVIFNDGLFDEYVADHPMTVKALKTFDRDWKSAAKNKLI